MNTNIGNPMTEAPVGKLLLQMGVPVMVGQLVILVYGLADSFFVSRIDSTGTWALGGIGLVFPLFFLFIAVGFGLSSGTASLVARAIGAGDQQALERVGDSALVLGIGGFVVLAAVFFAAGPAVVAAIAGSSMGPQAVRAGQDFLFWLTPGLSLLLVNQALAGILQGEGRMMTVFLASTASTALNIVLDPIFIFGCGMGVSGAGLATTLALMLSVGILLRSVMRPQASVRVHFRPARARAALMVEILRVGAPQAGNMVFLSVGLLFLNFAVSSLGQDVMGAWSLVGRADDLILMVAYGLSAALLTLVGQNSAAGRWDRVAQATRTAVVYGVVAGLGLSLVYIGVSGPLFTFLSGNPRVAALCGAQVTAISWSYAGILASIILNALFLGLGRPWPGVIMTVIRMELVLVPGVLLVVFGLHQGMETLLPFFAVVNLLAFPLAWFWAQGTLKRARQRKTLDTSPGEPEPQALEAR